MLNKLLLSLMICLGSKAYGQENLDINPPPDTITFTPIPYSAQRIPYEELRTANQSDTLGDWIVHCFYRADDQDLSITIEKNGQFKTFSHRKLHPITQSTTRRMQLGKQPYLIVEFKNHFARSTMEYGYGWEQGWLFIVDLDNMAGFYMPSLAGAYEYGEHPHSDLEITDTTFVETDQGQNHGTEWIEVRENSRLSLGGSTDQAIFLWAYSHFNRASYKFVSEVHVYVARPKQWIQVYQDRYGN